MKKLYFISLILTAATLFFGCKKDDNEPEPTTPQIQLDSTEVKEFINRIVNFDNEDQYPKSGSSNCRCFKYPIVIASDQKIIEPIEIKVHDTVSYTYRYQITNYTITDASGENMATEYISNDGYLINIQHKDLKGNTEYTVDLTLTLTQLVNGEWEPVVYKRWTPTYTCKVTFTTGELPGNTIEAEDILYQFPIDRQYNYMPKEYTQGYIMLSYDYENIFEKISDDDKKVVIKGINDNNFETQVLPYTTKECHDVIGQMAEINYSLESVSFNPQKIYSIQLTAGTDTIYQLYFRTSKFSNFRDRINSMTLDGVAFHDFSENYSKGFATDDFFDIFEQQQIDNTNTLVHLEADLENTEWYNNSIYKVVYDYILKNNLRVTRQLSYPPADAMTIFNSLSLNHDHQARNKVVFRYGNLFSGNEFHDIPLHEAMVNGVEVVKVISAVGQLGGVHTVDEIVVR